MDTLVLGTIFFGASIVFSMLGLGGGIIYVPLLLFFSFSYPVAAGTSLLLIMAGAISAAIIYARAGLIDWKFALIINSFSDLAAFFGGQSSFSPYLLKILFSLVLIVSATIMLKELPPIQMIHSSQGFLTWNHRFKNDSYDIFLPLILSSFIILGFWSAALGIGGGIFKIPLLVIVCGFPLRTAIATSSLMVATSSFWGVLGHTQTATIDLRLGIILAAVVILGGQIGSRISIKTKKKRLTQVFALILYLIAFKMILSEFFSL